MFRSSRFFIGVLNGTSDDDHSFEQLDSSRFIVSGQMHIEHVNDLLNCDLDSPRMTTISGMVFQKLDRLPTVGDEVDLPGIRARVVKMSRHRIDHLEISSGTSLQEIEIATAISDDNVEPVETEALEKEVPS